MVESTVFYKDEDVVISDCIIQGKGGSLLVTDVIALKVKWKTSDIISTFATIAVFFLVDFLFRTQIPYWIGLIVIVAIIAGCMQRTVYAASSSAQIELCTCYSRRRKRIQAAFALAKSSVQTTAQQSSPIPTERLVISHFHKDSDTS